MRLWVIFIFLRAAGPRARKPLWVSVRLISEKMRVKRTPSLRVMSLARGKLMVLPRKREPRATSAWFWRRGFISWGIWEAWNWPSESKVTTKSAPCCVA